MRYIKLVANKVVEVVDTPVVIEIEGFTQSDEGEIGQILSGGVFIDDPNQVVPEPQPLELTMEDYLIDMDFRLCMIELGLN